MRQKLVGVFTVRQIVIVAFLFIMALTFYLYGTTRNSITKTASQKFTTETSSITKRVSFQINEYTGLMNTAAAYIVSDPSATNKNWDSFFKAQSIYQKYPFVSSVTYMYFSDTSDNQQLQEEVNYKFGTLEPITVNPGGEPSNAIIVRASSENEIKQLLGQDYNDEPEVQSAIKQAIVSKDFAATPIITLKNGNKGFLIILPVFNSQTNQALGGVALTFSSSYNPKDALKNEDPGIGYKITDITNSASKDKGSLIYASPNWSDNYLTRDDPIKIANRQWLLSYSAPQSRYVNRIGTSAPIRILIGGLVLSVILGLLHKNTGYKKQIKNLHPKD